MTKINYIICSFLTLLRILDIVFTYILLNMGYVETNPLGFNPLSISLIGLWIIFMWILSYYIGDKNKNMEEALFIILLLFSIISVVVVSYETKLLFLTI